MAGDLLFIFVIASVVGAVGIAFVFFTPAVIRFTAFVNKRKNYPDWYIKAFDRSPWGWLQRQGTGMKPREVIDAAYDDPRSVPFLTWHVRAIGVVALLIASVAVAGGIARIAGYTP